MTVLIVSLFLRLAERESRGGGLSSVLRFVRLALVPRHRSRFRVPGEKRHSLVQATGSGVSGFAVRPS
jgi:hypothetical protein